MREPRISEIPSMTTTGARLRRLRGDTNQATAAAMLGIAPSTLGLYERDEADPPAKVIVAACRLYSVSADYLLGLSDHEHGLAPGSWIVDLDRAAAVEAGTERWTERRYAWPVPRRFKVLDSVAFDEMERNLRGKKR